MLQKPQPILQELIAKPSQFTPSSEETEIIGTTNPGVTTIIEDGIEKTLFMFRIIEKPKKTLDDVVLLPFYPITDNSGSFKIEFDTENKKRLKKTGKDEVKFFDGHTRLRHISYLKMARSKDGITLDEIDSVPLFYPFNEYQRFGLEDSRITKISGEDIYIITYVIPHRDKGVSTLMAITSDFKKFEKIPRGENPGYSFRGKDVVLFPEKVPSIQRENKLDYVALTRPNDYNDLSNAAIAIAFSPGEFNNGDIEFLTYWGNERKIIIGLNNHIVTGTGSQPVKLDNMWVDLYHEGKLGENSKEYVGKLFALNLKRPWECLYTSPVFLESRDFNKVAPGYVPNVAYPTAFIPRDNNGVIDVYWGKDDTYTICFRYYTEDLLKFLKG